MNDFTLKKANKQKTHIVICVLLGERLHYPAQGAVVPFAVRAAPLSVALLDDEVLKRGEREEVVNNKTRIEIGEDPTS